LRKLERTLLRAAKLTFPNDREIDPYGMALFVAILRTWTNTDPFHSDRWRISELF